MTTAVQNEALAGIEDTTVFYALKAALNRVQANFDDKVVRQHYDALMPKWMDGIAPDDKFHVNGRAKKYAERFVSIAEANFSTKVAKAVRLEMERITNGDDLANLDNYAPDETEQDAPPASPNGKTHGGGEPAQETPQEQTRPIEEPEAAGVLDEDDPGDLQPTEKTHREIAEILYRKFPEKHTSKDPRGYVYTQEKWIVHRLNEAFGVFGWQVKYGETGIDGQISCAIGAKIDGEWLWRENGSAMMKKDDPGIYKDDGRPSKTRDDIAKTAYTDAFKRAARMWGIGWYLLKD